MAQDVVGTTGCGANLALLFAPVLGPRAHLRDLCLRGCGALQDGTKVLMVGETMGWLGGSCNAIRNRDGASPHASHRTARVPAHRAMAGTWVPIPGCLLGATRHLWV